MCGMLTIVPAFLSCLLDPHFQPCEFLLPDFLHFFLGAIQLLQLLQHDLHVCNLLGDLIKVIDPSIPKTVRAANIVRCALHSSFVSSAISSMATASCRSTPNVLIADQ